MKNINSLRLFNRNEIEPNVSGDFVLYWMQINRRLHHNFALDYAVAWANKLEKPLLIYEGLRSDYPWASERIHGFILDGMQEHAQSATSDAFNYYPFVETPKHQGKGLLKALGERSCLIVSDEFPAFIIPGHNAAVAKQTQTAFVTIDANGILPMRLTNKAPYSAYFFRKTVQKHFLECWSHPPMENPLSELKNTEGVVLPKSILEKWPHSESLLSEPRETLLARLPINHEVKPTPKKGTRQEALDHLKRFVQNRLTNYGERNHPDKDASSELSPYLHFGKISSFEIVKSVFTCQPKSWSIGDIKEAKGKNRGFYNGHDFVEGFLDELVTWRELGYHFCHHEPNFAHFESLPDWVLQTFGEHTNDGRDHVYSLSEFEQAQTHDEIWNAAQKQLVEEGFIHNYLRMIWGKKILHWAENPEKALEIMIELNNKYALDGRNPNSYSGIFWVLGRFDRPWGPERPVFGKVRYMSTDSTRKKLKLNDYLSKYGRQAKLL